MTYQFNPFTNNLDIVGTGGGGGSVTTIDGDTGSITGSTVTIYANNAALNSGSSVSFVNSGTISTLNVSDANYNTIIGAFAGNLSISGNANCAYGLQSATGLTSGSYNNFFGNLAGTTCTSGSNNNFLGAGAGGSVSSGNFNLILGDSGANSLLTGSYNVILGPTIAGSSYTTSESSNILVSNAGVTGESNVMRLGTDGSGNGQVNMCFVAGIHGATVTGSAVLISSTGQLGDIVSSAAFKENIQDISESEHSILNCRPVSFNYKADPEKKKCYGMIAEEVEKVFPDLVIYKDGAPYSIKYHEMPALLLAEIQKLRAEIDLLKKGQ